MNIRNAILKAADSIERYPQLFDFDSIYPPNADCGTPGCALGWIAYHLGIKDWIGAEDGRVYEELGIAKNCCFPRLDTVCDSSNPFDWKYSPELCAKTLRLYADKYHPQTKTEMPPEVRAIFDQVFTENA